MVCVTNQVPQIVIPKRYRTPVAPNALGAVDVSGLDPVSIVAEFWQIAHGVGFSGNARDDSIDSVVIGSRG